MPWSSSIITSEDYEDLGNHSTKVMGETRLFVIAQAMIMMKGLMGWCLSREMALDRVRVKAELTEDELSQLKNWKSTMEKKFDLLENGRKELKQSMKKAKKALEDKDKKVRDLKDQLRQAKEVAICEYCDSDALLSELEDS